MPPRGWISREYGERQPAPMLIYSFAVALPWRIVTLLLPDRQGQATPPAVRGLYDDAGSADRDRLRASPAGCAVRRSGCFGGARVAMHDSVGEDGRAVALDDRRARAQPADRLRAGAPSPGDGRDHARPGRRPRRPQTPALALSRRRIVPVRSRRRGEAPRFRPPSRGRGCRDIRWISGNGASRRCSSKVRVARRQRNDRPVRQPTFCSPRPTCPRAAPTPVVLFEHNVEYMIWQRLCALETSPWRRALFEIEWRKLRAREADACRRGRPDDRRLRGRPAPPRRAGPRHPRRVDSDRRRYELLHARRTAASARRAWCSAARWTGIRTRTPSSTSPTRSCRASAPRSPTPR